MKKNYFLVLFFMLMLVGVNHSNAQHTVVNQVIVGSGGIYADTSSNVTIAAYLPSSGVSTTFGNIDTQSIQDIVISGKFAYVAAEDSIAKFDLDSYERLAVVRAFGVNKLLVKDSVLLASFQWPATDNFVKIFSTTNLALVSNIEGISDECAGLLVVDNLAYVAVPGGYLSTIGKIAIFNLNNYSLIDEINFAELGLGIYDLFYYNNQIMSVNRTPWGGNSSYILAMNSLGTHTEAYLINESLGQLVDVVGSQLYTVMNFGVGIIDLLDFSVINTTFITPPAMSIAAATRDSIDGLFYVTTTDYASVGQCTVYNAEGSQISIFETGVSPGAIAIDYRDNTGINSMLSQNSLSAYPNPATDYINFDVADEITNFSVVDISGRVLINGKISAGTEVTKLKISSLQSGLYFLVVSDDNQAISTPFIKK